MELRRWPDLLPDLLRDISGRLHHAVDFVRFHSVCRPWRDSYDAMGTGTTQPSFLPWLLAPNMKNHGALRLTCVFSNTSYSAPPLPARPHWVATADGTAVRYFGGHPYTSLHDPLTGVTTHVPPILEGKNMWFSYRCPDGVHCRDGTILVYMYKAHPTSYDDIDDDDDGPTKFRAALMHASGRAIQHGQSLSGTLEPYDTEGFA
jgi:hypothetical protein